MGAEGAVSGAAGSAAVSSAGAAGAADAAGSSFTLWLGADGCAADAAVLSASEDAESFFGVSVLFFFVSFWCCGPHRSHPPTAEPTAPPSGPQAGTPAGLWCQNRPPRWQAPSPPKPPSGPPHGASSFWCSCIFLSHSACAASKLYSNAASRRQKCFKCHLYVYSIHPTPSSRQCPSVSHAGRFVEVFHHS